MSERLTPVWYVRLGFSLQDCWVGVRWGRKWNRLDFWICLLPCLPIHVGIVADIDINDEVYCQAAWGLEEERRPPMPD